MKRAITAAAALFGACILSACDSTEADARQAVAAQLKDPASAKFRNVVTNGSTVCGEVNGKNSWGAYAGFTRFVATPHSVTMEPDRADDPEGAREYFDIVWSARCDSAQSYEAARAEADRLIAEGERLIAENR